MARKPHILTSLYVPQEKFDVFAKFEQIAQREYKDVSPLLLEAVEEYVKNHSEGNSTYQLDKWAADPSFMATPAFYAGKEMWIQYFQGSNQKEHLHAKYQAQMISALAQAYASAASRNTDLSKWRPLI